MRGWGQRLSSENGAHPGMEQAGVKFPFHQLPGRDSQLVKSPGYNSYFPIRCHSGGALKVSLVLTKRRFFFATKR